MSVQMKAYFASHLRDRLKMALYLVVFSVVITLISSGQNQCIEYTTRENDQLVTKYWYSSELGNPVTVLVLCSYLLPVLQFSFFKKRRNLDCVYALPISRREMGLVHYLTGLLLLVIPYSCSYFVNYLLLLRYPGIFYLSLLPEHYLISLLLGASIYTVFIFVFNQANSTGDGIWFIVLWSFVIYLVANTISSMIPVNSDEFLYRYMHYYEDMGIPFVSLNHLTVSYMDIIDGDLLALRPDIYDAAYTRFFLVGWFALGLLSLIGFCCSFGKQPAHHTQEVSESWFGYKLMIPVYAVCGMLLSGGFVIEIIAFVGYIIYRKGLRFKKSDWITLALLFVFLLICRIV